MGKSTWGHMGGTQGKPLNPYSKTIFGTTWGGAIQPYTPMGVRRRERVKGYETQVWRPVTNGLDLASR